MTHFYGAPEENASAVLAGDANMQLTLRIARNVTGIEGTTGCTSLSPQEVVLGPPTDDENFEPRRNEKKVGSTMVDGAT
jgi:hypothetical protein